MTNKTKSVDEMAREFMENECQMTDLYEDYKHAFLSGHAAAKSENETLKAIVNEY